MSSDNGYVIRLHPDGGFAAVHYSASADDYPLVDPKRHECFPSIQAACGAVAHHWTEYGVTLHPEIGEDD